METAASLAVFSDSAAELTEAGSVSFNNPLTVSTAGRVFFTLFSMDWSISDNPSILCIDESNAESVMVNACLLLSTDDDNSSSTTLSDDVTIGRTSHTPTIPVRLSKTPVTPEKTKTTLTMRWIMVILISLPTDLCHDSYYGIPENMLHFQYG
jgi:hypothetical protein